MNLTAASSKLMDLCLIFIRGGYAEPEILPNTIALTASKGTDIEYALSGCCRLMATAFSGCLGSRPSLLILDSRFILRNIRVGSFSTVSSPATGRSFHPRKQTLSHKFAQNVRCAIDSCRFPATLQTGKMCQDRKLPCSLVKCWTTPKEKPLEMNQLQLSRKFYRTRHRNIDRIVVGEIRWRG